MVILGGCALIRDHICLDRSLGQRRPNKALQTDQRRAKFVAYCKATPAPLVGLQRLVRPPLTQASVQANVVTDQGTPAQDDQEPAPFTMQHPAAA